jgi:peptidoglycan/xylan/chitin deacetylase (PgdA/CDA1 family)
VKAIVYHYVRPAPAGLPFFRYLHIEDFRRQLDALQRQFRVIDLPELLRALDGDAIPPDGLVLTFDDGLRDHLDHVLPELRARGLWAIFYVPTGPLATGRLLDVHRLHLLLGRHGGTVLADRLARLVDDRMLLAGQVRAFRELAYRHHDDDTNTKLVKRMLNYYVDRAGRQEVLDRAWADLGHGLPDAGEWYITADELRVFGDAGMLLGSHSVSHPVLATLAATEQAREIEESFAFLDGKAAGPRLRTFCYPYGGFHTFTAETERLLVAAGCRFSFNVEPRDITRADLLDRPQALPRYDCNLFPHGRTSIGAVRAEAAFPGDPARDR